MQTFMRGARPSPRHRLVSARQHHVASAPPPQFAVVPKQLSMWYNDTYGDCVTAQEAFSKAWYSVFCGLPELFIPDAEVLRWSTKYGFRDGADLSSVMDQMQKDGFTVGGVNYKDGAPSSVDYSNELVLQSANSTGAINIAIDANALPSSAGNQQGWYSVQKGNFGNTDHCVAISGYGRADFLFDALKVSLPSALSPSTPGYLLYTWSTIGFVTHDWVMSTCAEAWLRTPTTPGEVPVPPGPGPGPIPVPLGWPASATLTMADGTTQVYYPGQPASGLTIPADMLAKMQANGIDVAKYLASLGNH